MVAIDVLTRETEELLIVRAFETMTAWTVDCSHVSSLDSSA
jgi:anti-anti-sigma regulatory factor